MAIYTISLTEAEDKALRAVTLSPKEWIQNAVTERSRVAMDDIIKSEIDRRLSKGLPIPSDRDEIVMEAEVKSVKEKMAELAGSEQT